MVLALVANTIVAIAKSVAGLISGSAALLSEAAHSVADIMTEILLLTALHRSDRPADRRHPFGYGKERYFWSLLAAVSIFLAAGGLLMTEVTGSPVWDGAASVRIEERLRADLEDLDEVFLQPVPRSDPDFRERMMARYGSSRRLPAS